MRLIAVASVPINNIQKCKLLTKHILNHMKTLQPSNTVRFQAQNSSFPTHETAGAHEPPLDGSKKNNK